MIGSISEHFGSVVNMNRSVYFFKGNVNPSVQLFLQVAIVRAHPFALCLGRNRTEHRMFQSQLYRRRFADLSEQEILALAISSEEDDARIYRDYGARLRTDYPASASLFDGMAAEEDTHRQRLIDLHAKRFGDTIPLIRREHVAGYYARNPVWLTANLSLDRIRAEVHTMEADARQFYETAAKRTQDAGTRKLLGDLAAAEAGHEAKADQLQAGVAGAAVEEDAGAKRQFILTWVQPGLAGLMDGSVSTLAPIFATAFATQNTHTTFLVGLAASVGAGISMGFTEAAHDDGVLSGRGSPWKRGLASGVMTALGGLGHALPYLIGDFWTATSIAGVVVFIELWAIAWIQNRYMETPFLRAAFQVVLGGALVFAAGVFIGGG
jgi:erythrin-vacuolar iron transport family protein